VLECDQVYVKFKCGDDQATSRVVYNRGALEKGCLGGEWDFENQASF
jgi:hypothetical protein